MSLDRRRFVTASGCAALTAGLFACDRSPATEPAIAQQGVSPGLPGPQPIEDVADPSVVSDDVVEAFLAESMISEDQTRPPSDKVTSWSELQANPAKFALAKSVIQDVATNKLAAAEVPDEISADFLSLSGDEFGADGAFSDRTFLLSDRVLRNLAAANGYAQTINFASGPVILVGLRGLSLLSGDRDPEQGLEIAVREARVDHVRRRCLLCVWDTLTGTIKAFPGSTVPNLVNMQYYLFWRFYSSGQAPPELAWTQGDTLTCQLPQGLYQYYVGVHLRDAAPARRQPGALRQATAAPVLRARADVGYSVMDEWDPLDWSPGRSGSGLRIVGANIHAGVNRNMPSYASQGCQTIFGWYVDGPRPEMSWKDFQVSLGIELSDGADGAVRFTREGDRFLYILTSGREARLHYDAAGDPEKMGQLARVRLGSAGPSALALRKFLRLPGDSDRIDGQAMLSLLRWQGENDLKRDGVVTPRISIDWRMEAL